MKCVALQIYGEEQSFRSSFVTIIIDQALRALKKKMQREGLFREMKRRNYFEKPSEKRAREKGEAVRRARKLARKRAQREGLLPSKPRPNLWVVAKAVTAVAIAPKLY